MAVTYVNTTDGWCAFVVRVTVNLGRGCLAAIPAVRLKLHHTPSIIKDVSRMPVCCKGDDATGTAANHQGARQRLHSTRRASTVTYIITVRPEDAVIQPPLKHTVHVLHAAFGFINQICTTSALKLSVRPPRHHRQQQETAFRGEPQHCLGGKKEWGGLCWQSSQNSVKSASRTPWVRRESTALYARHPGNPNNRIRRVR